MPFRRPEYHRSQPSWWRVGWLRLGVVAGVLTGSGAALADGTEVALSVEAGSEYDSNIHRVEQVEDAAAPVVAGPLFRVGARLHLVAEPAERQRIVAGAVAGAKLYATQEGRREDVAVVAGNAGYSYAASERRALLGVSTSYYQARAFGDLEETDARTFSLADVRASATMVGPASHRFTAHAGVRRFRYRPELDQESDRKFDWMADHYGVHYRHALWREDSHGEADAAAVEVTATYLLERRAYDGVAFTKGCADGAPADPDCFVVTSIPRADLYHEARAELTYTGDHIYAIGYELQFHDSNSFGQSMIRHRVEMTMTTELAFAVLFTAQATVQYNVFVDSLLLARDLQAQSFVSIDEENRNALLMHATRDLTADWAVEARYALYSNEFATEVVRFRRQTGYLGLVYRYD